MIRSFPSLLGASVGSSHLRFPSWEQVTCDSSILWCELWAGQVYNIYDHARPCIHKQISLVGTRFCMDLNGMCKLTDPWASGSKLFFFSIFCTSAAHAVLKYPREEYTTGRKLRCSPLHTRQEVAGAVFGETMAYERAMYFKVDDDSKFFVVVEPQLHADLLLSFILFCFLFLLFFSLFFFSFSLWVIG